MIRSHTIVVLAKAPVAGRVKTRLCPPLSHRDAAEIAAAALADTLEAVAGADGVRHVLALDGDTDVPVPPSFEIIGQRDGDLGNRLDGALTVSDAATVVVGMDTPQVSTSLMIEALDHLTTHDAVLGPAEDGGFWAIGRAAPGPRLFERVPMSSPLTGAATQASLDALGSRTAVLPLLRDIDEIADAVAVAATAPDSRFARTFEAISAAAVP